MFDSQAVAEARVLARRSTEDQWRLAQLTFEQTTDAPVVAWAKAIGISPAHATYLRDTWKRFGSQWTESRTTRSFNEYYTLAQQAEARARKILDRANTEGRSVRSVARDELRQRRRMRDARELLRDRRRVREVLEDPQVRDRFERELRAGRHAPKPKQAPSPAGSTALARLSELRDSTATLLDDVLDARIPKPERRRMQHVLEDLEVLHEWLGSHLATGDRSFEDALDAVLAGGAVPQTGHEDDAVRPKKQAGVKPDTSPALEPTPPPAADEKQRKRAEPPVRRSTAERRGRRRRRAS